MKESVKRDNLTELNKTRKEIDSLTARIADTHNRLKALEKLFELENTFSDRDKAAGLIRALSSADEEVDEPEDN